MINRIHDRKMFAFNLQMKVHAIENKSLIALVYYIKCWLYQVSKLNCG